MVVLGIMIFVTGSVLGSQSSYNKSLILSNTAYDIALTMRSAETYGLSSRAVGSVVNAGYGLRFDRAVPGSFILFADTYPSPSPSAPCHPAADPTTPDARPGNCSYDASQSERITTYALGSGITVSEFCGYAAGAWSCSSGGALNTLDIVFVRPSPNPYISANGSYSSLFPVTKACITLTSPQGGFRHVSVGSSGEIIANATSCP